MHEVEAGCTIFGFEGVSGIGKSSLASRFAKNVSEAQSGSLFRIDLSDHPTEEHLLSTLYSEAVKLPRTFTETSLNVAKGFVQRMPGIAGRLFVGLIKDAGSKLGEDFENTIEAMAEEFGGDHSDTGLGGVLTQISEGNRRVFIRGFTEVVAASSAPVVILFDNYERAELSGQSFLRWLMENKPDTWTIVLVANVEKPVASNDWRTMTAPAIQLNSGRVIEVEAPDTAALAEWFKAAIGRSATQNDLSQAFEHSAGRPVWVKAYFSALAKHRKLPTHPSLEALHALRRNDFDAQARTVAELMTFAPGDAKIPRDWVESVAARLGVDHVGRAIDRLITNAEIKEIDRKLVFYNSSYRHSWRAQIQQSELTRIYQAWFEFYIEFEAMVLSHPEVGILLELADQIAVKQDGGTITRTATNLIESGSVNTALALVDASWKAGGDMVSAGSNVIEHALLAAQARLDVGHYRDAHESLNVVASSHDEAQKVRADLIRLKLALRQNAYPTVWLLSSKLERASPDDVTLQLSRELIVNTAYRDLLQQADLSDSVDRIRGYLSLAPASARAPAERALARSLAKLGDSKAAEEAARSALSLAEQAGEPRDIGNAKLAVAESLRYSGQHTQAISFYREAEALARGVGNRDGEIWSILGRACAFLEAGNHLKAEAAIAAATKLIFAPGFEHPLEAAHLGLIQLVLQALQDGTNTRDDVISRYQDIGIAWPETFIAELLQTGSLNGPIPI
tara:strand:+ start:398 stop:2608 length:2211 start_codon:yes stop_codon:yes gene_type:complete